MLNATTRSDVAYVANDYFFPKLLEFEDFDRFESLVVSNGRTILAETMSRSLQSFDELLMQNKPRNWGVHEKTKRTLITLLGEVTYARTTFIDEYGRHRIWADELLGIPKYSRLSTGAFLWIVRFASEESYRKTAAAFKEASGCCVSHITVMNCIHKEGALLKQEVASPGQKISQDRLFLEVDGLWVHVQSKEHRKQALPRFIYEQARKTRSFELKLAALYAGKTKVAPGRYKRGGLALTCDKGSSDSFWQSVFKMMDETYELDDVEELFIGADGGSWCGPERIEEKIDKSTKLIASLDPFHIMKKIWQAFPEGAQRDWAVNLAVRRKATSLAKMCERIAPKVKDKNRKKKVGELKTYMLNNADSVLFPKPSMGTMEGTNAHVGASRLKGRGRSWSRRGAEAMCLIRCALASGKQLVVPSKQVLFTEKELKRDLSRGAKSSTEIPDQSGDGYIPPHQVNTRSLKTAARYHALVAC